MKRLAIGTLLISPFLFGCMSTNNTSNQTMALTTTNSLLSQCDLPAASDRGPIRPSLFVVGTFDEGQWLHLEDRQMQYKGNGIYQLVRHEKAGVVNVQFTTMNWNPQFTVSGREMTVGQEIELKNGGFAKNTKVTIPNEGTYVWAIEISGDKKPLKAIIASCP